MAKKKKADKPRELTRRQLSQWQRQRRRQRTVTIGGIAIIAAIIVIVLLGWFLGEYRPLHQVVIRVNDTEYDMAYYIDALSLSGRGQPVENIMAIAGGVIRQIEQDELIRRGALSLGISVSDDEAEQRLISVNVPVNAANLDTARSVILQERLRDEYFENQVPASMEQVHMMAMALESESQAAEIRARLQNSENFTALAAEFSLDDFTRSQNGDLGWHPESIFEVMLGSPLPGAYAFGSEAGTLSQPRYDEGKSKMVGYWLARVTEREPEATGAQVQAVLLGSEEEAQNVRARLEAGEDLAALAGELSQNDESRKQGGEMGVVGKGEMSPALDGYIFNPETALETWSEPIRDDTVETVGVYWLIEVVAREDDRPLESADRDFLLSQEFNAWLSSLWADPGTVIDDSYLDFERQTWAAERAAKS